VIKVGALPASVEVQIEVDTRRSIVRATAFGTTELKKDDDSANIGGVEGAKQAAARSLKTDESAVDLSAETAGFYVFTQAILTKTFFGIFAKKRLAVRVVDKTGVVRLQRGNAEVHLSNVETVARELETIINKLTDFGDAGRALPDIHLLVGARIVNLSGLAELEQVITLAKTELENLAADEKIVIIASPR
ncbi:MAG: hydantoinase/oxoprolinase family protein, partial [Pyrinomonadaceae bacterium]